MGKKLDELGLREEAAGGAGVGDGPVPEQGAWFNSGTGGGRRSEGASDMPRTSVVLQGRPPIDLMAALKESLAKKRPVSPAEAEAAVGPVLEAAGYRKVGMVHDSVLYEEPKPIQPIQPMPPERTLVEEMGLPPLPPSTADPQITFLDEVADADEAVKALDLDPFPPGTFSWVSGPAGTGKTFLLRHRPYNEELVATTGIAAINLSGSTVNSLLGYFDTNSLRDAFIAGYPQAKIRGLYERGVRRINLDEVSMLGGDQLELLCDVFDDANEQLQQKGKQPMGLTLCGDFAQLPPVKAPFAFEAKCWGRFAENALRLEKIRRQADQTFIEALQHVRRGEGKKAVEFFAPRMVQSVDQDYVGSTIKAKNDEVDRYNLIKLRECKGQEFVYTNKREGKQRSEWKHIPDSLTIKEGAMVMVLSNLRRRYGYDYVNGDLATVIGPGETVDPEGELISGCKVRLHRTGGGEVVVAQIKRELKEGSGKDEKVVGWVEYMPLRLAYATTCHKSQGLSLDEVQIDIRNHFFGSPGMLYVALSRARTAEGIRLVGNPQLFVERCTTNKKILPWV